MRDADWKYHKHGEEREEVADGWLGRLPTRERGVKDWKNSERG